MDIKDAIVTAAKLLDDNGLGVVIPGDFYATPEQAALYVTEQDKCYAELYGISLADYMKWKDWRGGCTAKNKKGTRCLANLGIGYPTYPGDFVAGKTDRCHLHQA